MRKAFLLKYILLLTGVFVAWPAAVAGDAPQEQVEMAQYYIGLIYKGDQWASIPPDKAAEIQRGHRANIDRLGRAGQMVLAGPIEDAGDLRGIFVYRTATRAEAEALVSTDPAVQAGRLRVEIYPFWAPKSLENLSSH